MQGRQEKGGTQQSQEQAPTNGRKGLVDKYYSSLALNGTVARHLLRASQSHWWAQLQSLGVITCLLRHSLLAFLLSLSEVGRVTKETECFFQKCGPLGKYSPCCGRKCTWPTCFKETRLTRVGTDLEDTRLKGLDDNMRQGSTDG